MSTLVVEGLTVAFPAGRRELTTVVADVALRLEPGQITALVGESGCGKSTTATSLLGLPPERARLLGGRSSLNGVDILSLPLRARRALWGRRLAYMPQGAGASLNPARRVGRQLAEVLRRTACDGTRSRDAAEAIAEVGLDPVHLRRFPRELSGGQQQRVALALTFAGNPEVLVLDEPTSGLDVTAERAIADLIAELVEASGVATLFVSHNFGLVQRLATRTAVMYAGEIVESGPTPAVLSWPRHPYTAALLDAVPSLDGPREVVGLAGVPPPGVVDEACAFAPRCGHVQPVCLTAHVPLLELGVGRATRCVRGDVSVASTRALEGDERRSRAGSSPVLEVEGLHCRYGQHEALADLSLAVHEGETLGIVGESGSGKSTLLRAIAGLHVPAAGTISLDGIRLATRAVDRSRDQLKHVQLVFQDPDASLNPRRSTRYSIERPLRMFRPDLGRRARAARVAELLSLVRLAPETAERFPDELSGGQRQRVALARAFAAEPRLLLCDEVVSALDVSVQASIFELLVEVADQHGATVLFVTHDLGAARAVSDTIAVFRDGRLVESATTDVLLREPSQPYTRELLAAVPRLIR